MDRKPANILKEEALQLGFDRACVTTAERPETFDFFRRWIDEGRCAGMHYLADRADAREHPRNVLPGVRSILVLAVSYRRVLENGNHPVRQLSGIASYARGVDYHTWIRERLKTLSARHRALFPEGRCRGTVDTAPLLERSFAVAAGLGRIGKNTMLISPLLGSKFFLGELLSTETWMPTPELKDFDPCKNCRRCLEACPTDALAGPFVLDARRCLNYWTIEHRGTIPDNISEQLVRQETPFFGCDVCQEICPWNRSHPSLPEGTVDPRSLDEKTLRAIAEGTPLQRRWK